MTHPLRDVHDMYTILVTGGREFGHDPDQKALIYAALDDVLLKWGRFRLIQGGAKGADATAKQWANDREIECMQYDADWKKYGARAGVLRNTEMLIMTQPHMVVAFPGGNGTVNMVKQAEERKVLVWRVM